MFAADRGSFRVDKRRLGRDSDGFLQRLGRHPHVDGRRLSNEDLRGPRHRAETTQLGFDGVLADAYRQAKLCREHR
jgi:hypothetical protein